MLGNNLIKINTVNNKDIRRKTSADIVLVPLLLPNFLAFG